MVEGAAQPRCAGCVDGGHKEAKGTQEIGLQTHARPNGMGGRRLQGGD